MMMPNQLAFLAQLMAWQARQRELSAVAEQTVEPAGETSPAEPAAVPVAAPAKRGPGRPRKVPG